MDQPWESVFVANARDELTICLAADCVEKAEKGEAYCPRCTGRFPKLAERARTIRYRETDALDQKLKALSSGSSHVYCIQGGDLIKFGVARNVKQRLMELQCGSPLDLNLLGAIPCVRRLEKDLHVYLKEDRVRGEWFRASAKALQLVQIIQSKDIRALQKTLGCW